jgi:hypothetical protein
MAAPPRRRSVRWEGSDRRHHSATRRLRPADTAEEISIILVVRRRPDAPDLPSMEHWAKTPPGQRTYLSNEEADRLHGAAQEDLDKVIAFAAESRLTVVEANAARRTVQLSGSVEKMNEAFGTTLSIYETPAETYRGYDGSLHLPAELIEVVKAVFGLDNRRMAARAGGSGLTITNLTPPDVAKLYGFPSIPPAISGETIGIFEFGGGYAVSGGKPTDVDAFFAGLNPPLPAATLTAPVSILGGTNTVLGSPGHTNNDDAEVALDIDVAGSVASGATIAVYFISTNADVGWISAVTTAAIPGPGQPSPSVITISWAWREDDWSASQLQAITAFFQLAAAKGVTILAASGDKGTMGNADQPDGRAHVCFPACDPWVTAVGGTTIGNVSGTSFAEITWNDNGVTAGGISTVTDSSGHLVFPLPSWQVGAGVPPSINDGTTRGRGIPDIAGYANGYDIRLYGAPAGSWWGTSEASPLYAGLVAVLNAKLGYRLGYINPTLYAFGLTPGWNIFNDIDDGGSNKFSFTLKPPSPPTVITSPGYTAVKGWDACTGWGSIHATRFYGALAHLPILATALAHGGDFGNVCAGSFVDLPLTINNTGFGLLAISDITSSSSEFLVPDVSAYPLVVGIGSSIEVTVRFQPSGAGPASATLTVDSNDPSGPHKIAVAGVADTPRLDLVMADNGDLGHACVAGFVDRLLILSNSSKCPLSVTSVTSSSAEFIVPEVLTYPLIIGPGSSIPLPIRFAPTSIGAKSATLTVDSNDPAGAKSIGVKGTAPFGILTVAGSAVFGGVACCTTEQRTVFACNTGDCDLKVSAAELKHQHRAFRMINNPFPATIRPGASLAIVIEYHAIEREPRACELVIHSDDPHAPVKGVDVIAHTIWDNCCCKQPCCEPRHDCCQGKHKDCCKERRHDGCDEARADD